MATPYDTVDSERWGESANIITGGFVDNTEPHLLTPSQCVRLLNVEPTVAGRRQKRYGASPLGSGSVSLPPNGLHEFYVPLLGVSELVGQWGSKLYSSPGDDTWTQRATAVSPTNTPHMATLGRLSATAVSTAMPGLFLSSCVACTDNVSLPYGKLLYVSADWRASSVAGVRSRTISWFQGRLWAYNSCFSNLGPTYLQWSGPFRGEDFSNGQNVEIAGDSGDVGVAIVPARDTTPRLFLFNERSIYQLDLYWSTDGYYPTTANALDFTKSLLRPIVDSSGCVASRCVFWVPGQSGADLLFLSREGIRSLARSATDAQGGTPLPLSHRIQPTIDRINWKQAHRACGIFWDGRAYFAVPVDGSDVNNFVIAYDVHRDHFYELDWNVAAWTAAKIAGERKLFFMSATGGTESGLSTPATGATHGHHVYEAFSGLSDPFSLPIQFREVTRAFCLDNGSAPGTNLRIKKKWSHLDLALQSADTGCTITLQYKVDDDDAWSNLTFLYLDPTDASPVLPVQLPFSFGIGKMTRHSIQLRQVRSGYKIQFQIIDDSSYARVKIVELMLYANPMNPKHDH